MLIVILTTIIVKHIRIIDLIPTVRAADTPEIGGEAEHRANPSRPSKESIREKIRSRSRRKTPRVYSSRRGTRGRRSSYLTFSRDGYVKNTRGGLRERGNAIISRFKAKPEDLAFIKRLKETTRKEIATTRLWLNYKGCETVEFLTQRGIIERLNRFIKNLFQQESRFKACAFTIKSEYTNKTLDTMLWEKGRISPHTHKPWENLLQTIPKRHPCATWTHKLYSQGVTINLEGIGILDEEGLKVIKSLVTLPQTPRKPEI